jgi:uncharacterized SAM-binding protein YcdF (DUF218 family)
MHFYLFKAAARALLLPPFGLLILTILGALLIALRHRRSGWTCLITGLALTWLLSVPLVADQLSRLVEVYPAFDPAQRVDAQAIVILGGDGNRLAPEYGGQPAADLELLERLNYGAWLSRNTHLPILVTSDPRNVQAMAASLARDFQTPPRWVESFARDTFDNARNSVAMLRADHVNSILLVTSSTHMRRAMGEFTATGIAVTAAPVHVQPRHDDGLFPFLPSPDGMLRSNRALYELLGEPVREAFVALNLRRQQP